MVLRYVARPDPRHPRPSKLAGAYINCWVSTPSVPEAQVLARRAIRAEQWRIEEIEEVTRCEGADYLDRPESLAHFDEAVECGHRLVIHAWRSRRRARVTAPKKS